MEYFLIDPTTIDPASNYATTVRSIGDILDLETIDLALHELNAGEELPGGYHSHETQETVLFVIWGKLHIETPEQIYEIEPGNMFIVKSESPFRAFNPSAGETEVEVLQLNAPKCQDTIAYQPSE